MKFNCKKTGFTLAEVLIVLLITTVLTIFSVNAIRPRAYTTPLLYQRAHEALSDAAFNAWREAGDCGRTFAPDTGSNVSTLCNQLAGEYTSPACPGEKLGGYINTTGLGSCSNQGLDIPTTANEQNFRSDNMHFTSTNGMRFYISKELNSLYSLDSVYYELVNDVLKPVRPKWYIIFVDLDGEKGLGTMAQPADQNNTADIVPFALVVPPDQRPAVIPIGVPTMDKRYMTAVVKYTDDAEGKDRLSPSLQYKEAIIRAYGSQEKSGSSAKPQVPERIYFESLLPDGSNNTLFYVALPSAAIKLDDSGSPFGINDPGCKADTYGACSVIINSYSGASGR